jgi:hypothetical protein
VPIAFHEGDFSDSEIQAMTKAADTWNQFFSGSLGYGGLDYHNEDGSIRTLNEAKPLYSCNNPIIDPQGGGYNGAIVIYKQSIWAYKDKSSTIARTSTCPDGTRHFYTGFIELNFESFFVAGKKQPDLESIMLHEYGHLLGLKHSCEGASLDGIPNCSDLTLNPNYRSASLFPTFGYSADGKGEQRRKVNQNDQSRMNCLYQ